MSAAQYAVWSAWARLKPVMSCSIPNTRTLFALRSATVFGTAAKSNGAARSTFADRLADLYVSQAIDRAVVVYNHFVSPLVQTVVEQDVLPIPEGMLRPGEEEAEEQAVLGDFIYEPEPEEILARLLPFYLETELYRALLESAASKHGAQMTAMRNASKNAGELIDNLTLVMNRARQAEITQEILEVVAGADALTA